MRIAEEEGEDKIDRRSRDRDEELLPRLTRHPLEPGEATDRQQRDVVRRDAVAAGRQGDGDGG